MHICIWTLGTVSSPTHGFKRGRGRVRSCEICICVCGRARRDSVSIHTRALNIYEGGEATKPPRLGLGLGLAYEAFEPYIWVPIYMALDQQKV